MSQHEIVLCHPVRTAIGSFGGSLKSISAMMLGGVVIRETLRRSGLDPEKINGVVMGNVIQAGNRMNPARQAAIAGGLPEAVPAFTVNRVCGSGVQAIVSAAQEISFGFSKAIIAGGMENMDMAPYLLPTGRWGARMGNVQTLDSMLHDGLVDAFSQKHSGWHTEDLVDKYNISREDQDRWALRSQLNFSAAQRTGVFDAEIAAVEIETKNGIHQFKRDEANRPDTTLEVLQNLKPAFRTPGTITAGNAPGLNSGAAALIVAERSFAEKNNLEAVARLVSFGIAAVEPGMFGIGPVPAVKQALERANWTLDQLDRIEINEAFAAVPLAVMRELGIDENIVNVEGGAIAHGHPIGATGAILTTRLIHSLQRAGLKRGLVTLCIGGGQGIALAIELL
ncbi:3-ketoacyl-CoA thiolase [Aquitalea magnusonii]|uniref:3-ketoacyl-CoA thiolase n=1 Tax=Aquitalea magnusonii TaxID=332411 RepID=A0A3G9GA97_9NEIS|nr:thiolase family protein [Aquitalea magnusonii]BBF84838.1 3-ketoacyl-CoA thiolase [Aquitalea magnusonii]